MRRHGKLTGTAFLQSDSAWRRFEFHDAILLPWLAAKRGSGPNPRNKLPVLRRVLIEALAAAVAHCAGRLQQQQALLRFGDLDSGNALSLHLGREHLIRAALYDPLII